MPESLQRVLSERGGAMSVAEYMAWCLTGQEAAYYRRGDPIGRGGDFITAPEISQIFGELIGLWAGAVWRQMGEPNPVILVELGPGRGALMADALRALRVVPGFLEAARLHLVERSETLRQAQAARLGAGAPIWHDTLDSVPDGPGVLLANEFFDALPIRQILRSGGAWRERMVRRMPDGSLAFGSGAPADSTAITMPAALPQDGDILETRPSALPWLRALGRRARAHPTAALVIDYGHERDGYGDTLQAVRAHGYADPLAAPGEADLSAHVNFAELARMARNCGLHAWGPLPQGDFLMALGLEARLERLMNAARDDQRTGLLFGARRLTDPFQMGSLFKALALTSPTLGAPPPFLGTDAKGRTR
jgi:SAM-dependent MidA family methyltransferase